MERLRGDGKRNSRDEDVRSITELVKLSTDVLHTLTMNLNDSKGSEEEEKADEKGEPIVHEIVHHEVVQVTVQPVIEEKMEEEEFEEDEEEEEDDEEEDVVPPKRKETVSSITSFHCEVDPPDPDELKKLPKPKKKTSTLATQWRKQREKARSRETTPSMRTVE